MTNVITFPIRRLVQICVGRHAGQAERRFFVMISDADMRDEIVWDGSRYGDAMLAAGEWVRQGYRLDDVYGRGRLA